MRHTDDKELETLIRETDIPVLLFIYSDDQDERVKQMQSDLEHLEDFYDVSFRQTFFRDSEEIRLRYQISDSPSLVLFEGGMLVEVLSGYFSKQHIRTWLNENL